MPRLPTARIQTTQLTLLASPARSDISHLALLTPRLWSRTWHLASYTLPICCLPQGTYLGTLEGVNHLDLVGWINTARYKWAEIMGREIKFKPATFYLGIADHLARVVEGQAPPESESESESQQHQQLQLQNGQATDGGDEQETRPGPSRETSDEREDRERGEMADSLEKGQSQAGTPTPTPTANSQNTTGDTGAHRDRDHPRPQFQRQPTGAKQGRHTIA